MLETGAKMYLPKQDVAEGQKHGYIGEAEGLVETFEPEKPGNSNAPGDPIAAQARVDAAQANLAEAERQLAQANSDGTKAKKAAEDKGGRAQSTK